MTNHRSPEYRIWYGMIRRCTKSYCRSYQYYGGRGITVDPSWLVYENFIIDMGLKPSPDHSLDRINVNGPYSKSNCRWATKDIQANNRQISSDINKIDKFIIREIRRLYTEDKLTIPMLTKEFGLSQRLIYRIIHYGNAVLYYTKK